MIEDEIPKEVLDKAKGMECFNIIQNKDGKWAVQELKLNETKKKWEVDKEIICQISR